MAYTPYYNGGWKIGVSGGTPIAAAALNHMEEGIAAAVTLSDIVLATGEYDFGQVAANTSTNATVSIGKTLSTTSYMVVTEPLTGNITAGVQSKTATSFALFIRNVTGSQVSGKVRWAVIRIG